ncbi:MAG TPA: hypothetical protein PK765_04845 [bacterium]|nr:hypothetical protein [bacterium]
MNVQSIADLARSLSVVDAVQVPDDTLLPFVNIVYADLWSTIVREVNEDFFFHTWYINTIGGTNAYSLPVETGTTVGMVAGLGVSVKYRPTGEYVRLRQSRVSSLDRDLDSYTVSQSEADPFFILGDTHILVFPEPTESVIGGMKLYGVRASTALVMTDSESSVAIPREYHHLIALGVRAYIHESRGNLSESESARAHYEREKERMARHLSERMLGTETSTMPDLSHLS